MYILPSVLWTWEEFLVAATLIRTPWEGWWKIKRRAYAVEWGDTERGMTCLSDQRWAVAVTQQRRVTYFCLVWHLWNHLHMGRGHGLNKLRSFLLLQQKQKKNQKNILVAHTACDLQISPNASEWLRDDERGTEVKRDKKRLMGKRRRGQNVRTCDSQKALIWHRRVMGTWGELWKRWFVGAYDERNFTVHVSARIGYLCLHHHLVER